MKKGKFLSSLAAVALSASMLFAPVASSYATSGTTTNAASIVSDVKSTKVTIHAMDLTDAKTIGDFPIAYPEKGKDGTTYVGKALNNSYFGDSKDVKPLKGVSYRYWKVSKAQLEEMQKNPSAYNTANKVKKYLGAGAGEGIPTDKSNDDGQITVNGLGNGYYWFVEDEIPSDANRQISQRRAVPIALVLPFANEDGNGYLDNVHVYPKYSTSEQPKIDKNFDKQKNGDVEGITPDDLIPEENRDIDLRDGVDLTTGNDVDNAANTRDKGLVSRNIGDKVPYVINTIIPAGSNYKTMSWNDTMSNGLTFDKNVTINATVGQNTIALVKGVDYNLIQDARGFKLSLTSTGLDKVNAYTNPTEGEAQDVKFVLRYTATLNEAAKVDAEEVNDVKLEFGNNPSNSWEPTTTQPENGEITVSKDWAKDGSQITAADKDVEVDFVLQVLEDGEWTPVETYKGTFENNFTKTFTDLDNDKTYRVVEENITGYAPEFVTEENGVISIVNQRNEVTPKKGQISVNKTWANKQVPTDDSVKVTWVLYDEKGKDVASVTLTNKNKANEVIELPGTVGADNTPIKFTVGNNFGGNFTNLKDGKYRVRERVSGYDQRYLAGNDGNIEVSNTPDTKNPKPINPSEPRVTTYGHKFVKTNDQNNGNNVTADDRLAGAEFVITRGTNEYLASTTPEQRAQLQKSYEDAQNAYLKYVNSIELEEGQDLTAEQQTEISRLETARDDAYKAQQLQDQWTWKTLDKAITSKDEAKAKNVAVFRSDAEGRFEVKGLAKGNYNLHEITVPEGYTVPSNQKNGVKFETKAQSYEGEAEGINIKFNNDDDNKVTDAKQIVNRNVTIPETGGIGSLIFIVAGLALMGVAFVAMKRRNSYEEA